MQIMESMVEESAQLAQIDQEELLKSPVIDLLKQIQAAQDESAPMPPSTLSGQTSFEEKTRQK